MASLATAAASKSNDDPLGHKFAIEIGKTKQSQSEEQKLSEREVHIFDISYSTLCPQNSRYNSRGYEQGIQYPIASSIIEKSKHSDTSTQEENSNDPTEAFLSSLLSYEIYEHIITFGNPNSGTISIKVNDPANRHLIVKALYDSCFRGVSVSHPEGSVKLANDAGAGTYTHKALEEFIKIVPINPNVKYRITIYTDGQTNSYGRDLSRLLNEIKKNIMSSLMYLHLFLKVLIMKLQIPLGKTYLKSLQKQKKMQHYFLLIN